MRDAEWLRDWCREHVSLTVFEDIQEAEQLASLAQEDAKSAEISIKQALRDEGHLTLCDYMLSH